LSKKLPVALLVLALVALGVGLAWRNGYIGDHALRIAALLPLSGPNARTGTGMRNSIRLAVDEVNARGGIQGRHVRLLEFDDASDPKKAEARAREIVADKRIVALIGTYDYETYAAIADGVSSAGVAFLPAGPAARDSSSVGVGDRPNESALLPLGNVALAAAAKYAWDTLKARDFVYVRDLSLTGYQSLNAMRRVTSALFKRIQTGEEVLTTEADVAPLVEKLRRKPPDYVFFAGDAAQGGRLLALLREAGVKSTFQIEAHLPSQEFIDAARGHADGALAVFHGVPDEACPEGREFLKRYAAAGFSTPPSVYGIYAYAEAQSLLSGMDRSFLSRPSVIGAMTNEQFDTILGPIRYNIWFGSTYQTVAIYQVEGGRWKPAFVSGKSGLQPFAAR
jgi:branched-chain amino acid transport system substrate-binding protein